MFGVSQLYWETFSLPHFLSPSCLLSLLYHCLSKISLSAIYPSAIMLYVIPINVRHWVTCILVVFNWKKKKTNKKTSCCFENKEPPQSWQRYGTAFLLHNIFKRFKSNQCILSLTVISHFFYQLNITCQKQNKTKQNKKQTNKRTNKEKKRKKDGGHLETNFSTSTYFLGSCLIFCDMPLEKVHRYLLVN